MPIYLIFVFFAVLTVAIAAFGYQRYARPGRVYERLGEPVIANPTAGALGEMEPRAPREFRLLEKIGSLLPVSSAEASDTETMLMHAGYRSDHSVKIFFGLKVLSTLTLLIVGLSIRNMSSNAAMHVILPLMGGLAGYLAPGFLLDRQITKRQTILKLALPDALDLLVISVEAGLGLDQALQYVAAELRISHKELTEELSLVTLEIRAGKRRIDALQNLGERTGEPELKKLVSILIQNDRFGTSIAESLRSHSDYMRVRRRQEAEERAAKVGVKLVFPIFFFILPAMMLVCAGPGVLQVVKYLLPLMSGAM